MRQNLLLSEEGFLWSQDLLKEDSLSVFTSELLSNIATAKEWTGASPHLSR